MAEKCPEVALKNIQWWNIQCWNTVLNCLAAMLLITPPSLLHSPSQYESQIMNMEYECDMTRFVETSTYYEAFDT